MSISDWRKLGMQRRDFRCSAGKDLHNFRFQCVWHRFMITVLRQIYRGQLKCHSRSALYLLPRTMASCMLECLQCSHDPIPLPHETPVVIGRSPATQIVDPRCSRFQGDLFVVLMLNKPYLNNHTCMSLWLRTEKQSGQLISNVCVWCRGRCAGGAISTVHHSMYALFTGSLLAGYPW